MIKKIINPLLAVMISFNSLNFIEMNAETITQTNAGTKEITLDFRDYSFTTIVDSTNPIITYMADDTCETYTVYDSSGENVIDKFTSENISLTRASDERISYFTRDKSFGSAVTLRYTVCVQYYSSGSFRSFNSLNYTNLAILSNATPMELYNQSDKCWSATGSWPTTTMQFSYTANLRTTGTVTADVGKVLLSVGFSQTTYYYRIVNGSGTFNLYN